MEDELFAAGERWVRSVAAQAFLQDSHTISARKARPGRGTGRGSHGRGRRFPSQRPHVAYGVAEEPRIVFIV
jgi:hypothetical protein